MAFYNTTEEVDRFAEVLQELVASRRKTSNAVEATTSESAPAIASIRFPAASAGTPDDVAEELLDEFLMFDDRESKTKLLLELGQELPDSFRLLKSLTSSVPGCMSEVYLIGRSPADDKARIEFAGDSNAQIVRGLIALLQKLFSGQRAADVLAFDLDSFFREMGLDQFITSQRRSGLAGMVARIRHLAESVAEQK
jgi:cysteine desulfurase/selenocysteine lyase